MRRGNFLFRSRDRARRPVGGRLQARGRRLLPLLALALSAALGAAPETPVNDAPGAVAAARKAWDALYDKGRWHEEFGPKAVARFEPYTAINQGGIWTVRGTVAPGYRGVTLVTTVRQSNGAVRVEEVDVAPGSARP